MSEYKPLITELYDESEKGVRKINPYYEGFLNDFDANFLLGYTAAMEKLKTVIVNLINSSDLALIGFDTTNVNVEKVIKYLTTDYDPFSDEDLAELNSLSQETKIAMVFLGTTYTELFYDRNECGLSMIAGMDEKIREENQKKYMSGEHENILEAFKKSTDDDYLYPTIE